MLAIIHSANHLQCWCVGLEAAALLQMGLSASQFLILFHTLLAVKIK